ncbi:MAG TPA: hypothetical protein VF595_07915 [Tepidisphaeraceae bacterium]
MRSILITLAVLVVLVAAFSIFLLTQKASPRLPTRSAKNPATLPAPTGEELAGSGVGAGEGGWVQTFDKKTGDLINEFRADHFDPPVNNQIHVVRPDARFYAKDGQVLTLRASYGDITMAQGAPSGNRLGAMQSQPPSHGTLHDVTLGLLETAESEEPILVATLPIVAFDNDTLRLNTVTMTKDGQEILADRVPITVRGRDYDFDGEGLTIRYNQRDRRLEFLEVAHGKRLVIKNAKAFSGSVPTADRGPLRIDGRPIELATADPEVAPRLTAEERERRRERRIAATRRAAQTATRAPVVPNKPHETVAYRATFNEEVRLLEGDASVGSADRMTATFTFEPNAATTRPATQPASAPAAITTQAEPLAAEPPATRPARRAAVTQPSTDVAVTGPATRPARRAATRAATKPTVSGPIEIQWAGKLTVVPQALAESGLRSAADRIVELYGKPVNLRREGSTVVAAYVWAAVEGNRFRAAPDATTPHVTVRDPSGTTLTTESIEADGDDAILHGRSKAELVLASDGPPKTLRTTWTDFATIRITTKDGKRGIERAVFRGQVDVQHPQLKLTSDTLALGFVPDPQQEQPQLSTVRADGAVRASVTGEDGVEQKIAAATLDLGTAAKPDGTLAVRSMHAHGDVVASDPKLTLRADDLTTTLATPGTEAGPAAGTTPTAFAVEQLTAAGHVQFATVDGAAATADRLSVDRAGGAQWVTLTGTPARVSDPQSTLTGEAIRVDATGAHASIDGPGTLRGSPKPGGGKPGQPIDVAWKESLTYDGPSNRATVVGDIVVTSQGADGTVNHAKGGSLEITFVDAPDKPAAASPTSQPAGFGAVGGPAKQVKSLTLSGRAGDMAEISSHLYPAGQTGNWLRRTFVYAPALTIYSNPDGSPGAIDVPSGGRLLYEEAAPAAQPATPKPATRPASLGRGTVALQWTRRMTYDPAKKQAILDGDVVVVHRAPGADPVKMEAPRLIADVSSADGPQGAELTRMTADQGATLYGRNMRIDAARAMYEPATDRIIATGTPRQPVEWYDEKGLSRGSFAEMWWNVKTNQPERVRDVSVEMNR